MELIKGLEKKEYYKRYYMDNLDKWKTDYKEKEGLYLYYITDMRENNSFWKVGSTTRIFERMNRHKSKEVIKYLLDNKHLFYVEYVDLLDIDKTLTRDDLLNVEEYLTRFMKPYFKDRHARADKLYDEAKARELWDNVCFNNSHLIKVYARCNNGIDYEMVEIARDTVDEVKAFKKEFNKLDIDNKIAKLNKLIDGLEDRHYHNLIAMFELAKELNEELKIEIKRLNNKGVNNYGR